MMHVHLPTQVYAFELSENTDLTRQLTPVQQFFTPGLSQPLLTQAIRKKIIIMYSEID